MNWIMSHQDTTFHLNLPGLFHLKFSDILLRPPLQDYTAGSLVAVWPVRAVWVLCDILVPFCSLVAVGAVGALKIHMTLFIPIPLAATKVNSERHLLDSMPSRKSRQERIAIARRYNKQIEGLSGIMYFHYLSLVFSWITCLIAWQARSFTM